MAGVRASLAVVAASVMVLVAASVPYHHVAGVRGGVVVEAAPAPYTVLIPEIRRMATDPQSLAPQQGSRFVFGVYPGGVTGETPHNYAQPRPEAVVGRLKELAGDRRLVVHLYTGWMWDGDWIDAEVKRYADAGFQVVVTVRYAPPADREGDVAGYEAYVRSLVRRLGANPAVMSFCIGNEANAYGSPDASDGPFARSHEAVARGVVAAADELRRMGSSAKVGFNFSGTNADADARFIAGLVELGGPEFVRALGVIGVQLYPGIWYAGGVPYDDMVKALESARRSVDSVTGLRGMPLEVLETGAPLLDEAAQASRLEALVRATLDTRERLNVVHLNWFDLWDSDSGSSYQFAHYGLLRSDLSYKPAFPVYRDLIARHS
ncbi:MAG TPA: hypothetical protein VG370_22520 [Chloroflexota bacterium]|jgi:hypothetical protein|nr:hypothetical protein [Chloroflexota bacterium]